MNNPATEPSFRIRISLKNFIVPNIPLSVGLVIGCIAIWILADMVIQFSPVVQAVNSHGALSISSFSIFLSNLTSLLLTLFNAFLLSQINNRFTIIRTRTFLPVLLFLLFMSVLGETHLANGAHATLTIFILSLFYFFGMSRDRYAAEQAFMGSFLLSLCGIIMNPLTFLIPVCWIGFIFSQSFSLRTFLASVFGSTCPWIFYLAGIYVINGKINWATFFPMPDIPQLVIPAAPILSIFYFGLIFIVFIICEVGIFSLSNNDAAHTRNKLNFLLLIAISLMVITIIFPQYFTALLPFFAFVLSLLFSHPFTLKQNNFYGIVFIALCILNIAYLISKLILI